MADPDTQLLSPITLAWHFEIETYFDLMSLTTRLLVWTVLPSLRPNIANARE
jgi:hypothetical protein